MAKGSLGCGLQTIKYFLFFVNVIFLLIGLGLIGVGAYVASEVSDFKDAFEDGFTFAVAIPVVAITLGVFIAIGAAMGCLGALKENTCMIKTFLFFLVLVIIAEIGVAGAIIAYNESPSLQTSINDAMAVPFEKCQKKDLLDAVTPECAWLPTVQSSLKCCGYDKTRVDKTLGYKTFCVGKDAAEQLLAVASADQFCNVAIIDVIKDNLALVAGILGGIFFVEVALMVGTCCLICGINDDNKYA